MQLNNINIYRIFSQSYETPKEIHEEKPAKPDRKNISQNIVKDFDNLDIKAVKVATVTRSSTSNNANNQEDDLWNMLNN